MIVDVPRPLESDVEVVRVVPRPVRAVPARVCKRGAVHLVPFESAQLKTTCHPKPAQQRSCQRYIRLLFSRIEPRRGRESSASVGVHCTALSIQASSLRKLATDRGYVGCDVALIPCQECKHVMVKRVLNAAGGRKVLLQQTVRLIVEGPNQAHELVTSACMKHIVCVSGDASQHVIAMPHLSMGSYLLCQAASDAL